jgi:predicted metal-dependent peptidase
MLYLTDGYGPEPTTRPNCKLLWVFPESNEEYFDEFGAPETLPFGPNIQLSRS